MQSKILNKIFVSVVMVSVVGIVLYNSEKRTEALMELCADHVTKTLYECNANK